MKAMFASISGRDTIVTSAGLHARGDFSDVSTPAWEINLRYVSAKSSPLGLETFAIKYNY